jgi:predicted SprT family Zn-dependent metalloprotease
MLMGDDGERCHNYRAPENSTKKKFTCNCGIEFNLTPHSVKKAKTGVYYCKHCKTNLKEFVK